MFHFPPYKPPPTVSNKVNALHRFFNGGGVFVASTPVVLNNAQWLIILVPLFHPLLLPLHQWHPSTQTFLTSCFCPLFCDSAHIIYNGVEPTFSTCNKFRNVNA